MAHERKKIIDEKRREEAEQALQRRENVRKIREYVENAFQAKRVDLWRVKSYAKFVIVQRLIQKAWNLYVLQLAEIKRKNDMMWVALSASMLIKRFMKKKGAASAVRLARYAGTALVSGAQFLRDTHSQRAA